MNPIYIYFESFSSDINAETYVQNVLNKLSDYYTVLGEGEFNIDLSNHVNLAKNICNNTTENKLPLSHSSDFPELDKFNTKRVNMMVTCAKGIIDEVAPLADGENQLSIEETYLSKNWKEFSSGCGVLRRTSNFAVVNFLFPDTTIGKNGTVNKEFSNYPGANKIAMKRSAKSQLSDPALSGLMDTFIM